MSHGFNQITPTDHFGWHKAYLPVYSRLFAPLKDTCRCILEIGTDGGGGLLMYRDFFKEAKTVIGADINPQPEGLDIAVDVYHVQIDAYTAAAVEKLKFGGRIYAVAIDDGPHTLESQKFFVANYPHLLIPEGIAIVEDVQDITHFAELNKCVPEGFFGYGIDLRMHDDRYDNLLFVVQRA